LNGSTLTLADDQNAHLFINAQLLTGGGDHDIAIIGPGTINLTSIIKPIHPAGNRAADSWIRSPTSRCEM
jgi:hypothetical protein